MKYVCGVGVVAALFAATVLVAGCEKKPSGAPPAPPTPKTEQATAQVEQRICPVMGNPIDKNIYVDYNGRRIYFCCNACPAEFKKDPEKYLKKVDEELKGASRAK